MQASGAEMLRIACCLGIERGVEICAPVHDAVLIVAPIGEINAAVTTMRVAMEEASCAVLDGFVLRTEAEIVKYPYRYMHDEDCQAMWNRVWRLVEEIE